MTWLIPQQALHTASFEHDADDADDAEATAGREYTARLQSQETRSCRITAPLSGHCGEGAVKNVKIEFVIILGEATVVQRWPPS